MKYVPSLLGVGQLSKSAGSTTASRNRFGSYVRNRVQPVNPQTVAQQSARASMAAGSQTWRTLTDGQRLGWGVLGGQIVRSDSLGQTYTLTGFQAFMLTYRNLITIGETPILDAPAYLPPAAITSMTITATEA